MFADFDRFALWRVTVYCLWPGLPPRMSAQIIKMLRYPGTMVACRSEINLVIYFDQFLDLIHEQRLTSCLYRLYLFLPQTGPYQQWRL